MIIVWISIAKLRKVERNAKGKRAFLFISECTDLGVAKVTKSREQNKEILFLFLPRQSKFAIFDGKVKKKNVKQRVFSFFFCCFVTI